MVADRLSDLACRHLWMHFSPTRAATATRVGELPIVGDLRGAGHFWALELVKDPETREPFTRAEGEALLRGFLAPRLHGLGVIARTDDRGMPVVQLAPPLVAGPAELDVVVERVHRALREAGEHVVA